TGLEITDEKLFFFASTVREVINILNKQSENIKQTSEMQPAANWQEILRNIQVENMAKIISLKPGLLAKIANILLFPILSAIGYVMFWLKVKGKNNIPSKGPLIFCPNHTSYLDAPLLAIALGMPTLLNTYFLGYSAYLDHPCLKWSKKLFRLISLDPASELDETLKQCSFILRNSKMLCMFPEGSRSVDGEIKDFKRGVGILIKELNVAVIPVYINGTHRAWPVHRLLPRPAKVEISFGKKIMPEDLMAEHINEIDIYGKIAYNLKRNLLQLKEQTDKGI
ncbi:MAG: 1-acyl-sn-glycerol-3-phosphate acyltransferase, partial [Candidatus Omnitrophica bacterium]|nr:1-acyl-sn-glycerol-3-phosphate acyltransferase [Candidatus Omnitrophota bacterium]